jgi:hypothetical protein
MENCGICSNITKSGIIITNKFIMHNHVEVSVDEQLTLSSKFKRNLYISLSIGLALFAIGVLMAYMGVGAEHGHGTESGEVAVAQHGPTWITRMWAVLWHNSVFFAGISAMGLFFVCVQYVAWAGWSSLIKRVPEAFGSFLPYAAAAVVLVFLFGNHDLFHWTHHGLYEKFLEDGKTPNPEYDSIIAGKAGYLNFPFYLGRMLVFFGLWYFVWTKIRKNSLEEDLNGGEVYYNKSIFVSAIFLIIFASSTPMAAWDWIMSIDTHWFSTMFGWYVFASWWVTGLASITLICIFLKENGYLKAMTENHFHDLGKFVFAFSIFWTYIWFGQFLLIFYANLPEETVYFIDRLRGFNGHYTGLFFFSLVINFAFPFLILMTRDAKRKMSILKVVTIAIILGHWLDFYMMIMPGTTKGTSGFGFMELGALMFFASAFIIVVTNTMTKAKLIPAKHPMLEEALHHNI